jgi:DNA (cytosine-5)-methyltransferase 1
MSWEKHLSQYQQIGNAVPPLLAAAIANQIATYFSDIESHKDDIAEANVGLRQLDFFAA